jgi:hypothetical protein
VAQQASPHLPRTVETRPRIPAEVGVHSRDPGVAVEARSSALRNRGPSVLVAYQVTSPARGSSRSKP